MYIVYIVYIVQLYMYRTSLRFGQLTRCKVYIYYIYIYVQNQFEVWLADQMTVY